MIPVVLKVFFLTVGTFFMMIAALGVYRMPDVYNQLHTSTKAVTLALVNLLLGALIDLGSISVAMKAILIIAFQFMTAPVAAHMISRAHYPSVWDETILDEMEGELTAGKGREEPPDSVTQNHDVATDEQEDQATL
jgi:multicomponent Na+:H+ antiporter subunit G